MDAEDKRFLMMLNEVSQVWEKETEERGRNKERQAMIISLMKLRYGEIDEVLESLQPRLLLLGCEEYTRLLLQLSKEKLIQHFS